MDRRDIYEVAIQLALAMRDALKDPYLLEEREKAIQSMKEARDVLSHLAAERDAYRKEGIAQRFELDKITREISEREATLEARMSELSAKEVHLQKRDTESDVKRNHIKARDSELLEKEASHAKKIKSHEEREKSFLAREESVAAREREISIREEKIRNVFG